MDQDCCSRAYHALGQVSLQLYCSVQLKCPVVGPPTLYIWSYSLLFPYLQCRFCRLQARSLDIIHTFHKFYAVRLQWNFLLLTLAGKKNKRRFLYQGYLIIHIFRVSTPVCIAIWERRWADNLTEWRFQQRIEEHSQDSSLTTYQMNLEKQMEYIKQTQRSRSDPKKGREN
jgi:hypothetical protein